MFPIILDGMEVPLHGCFYSAGGDRQCFSQVTREAPFCLLLHQETAVYVEDVSLTQEPHTVGMGFRVPGLGMLRFDFTDQPSGVSQPR